MQEEDTVDRLKFQKLSLFKTVSHNFRLDPLTLQGKSVLRDENFTLHLFEKDEGAVLRKREIGRGYTIDRLKFQIKCSTLLSQFLFSFISKGISVCRNLGEVPRKRDMGKENRIDRSNFQILKFLKLSFTYYL